ncbi:GntR family transcriptional regulator [Piscinibacter sakaiensis]|uniref:Transcriptional regulator, GntR family n=1 Tax=Piscinibacter sakaiensis TaxID=1547922 RepID=A0A0K8P205_PISS1|nr:GntR family transcriptional regulator [Piscinibacter sakaiensis]GAP36697.1 transcriptional regulator, GntR family [Piscinibacter sakaiensis]
MPLRDDPLPQPPGPPPPLSARSAPSQTVRAQLGLRALILDGVLAPGQRIAELQLVERLGVSRTPVRGALMKLAEEGLVEPLPNGGHAVKAFEDTEIHDAIEVRGTLEGLAARLAAERGVPATRLAEARQGLAAIDALLAAPTLDADGFGRYVALNTAFHDQLAAMAGSAVVRRQLERAKTAPFASPDAFVLVRSEGPGARDVLVVAQAQHRALLEAIARREGARAEAVAREHARLAQQNLRLVLQGRGGLRAPGALGLIREGPRGP